MKKLVKENIEIENFKSQQAIVDEAIRELKEWQTKTEADVTTTKEIVSIQTKTIANNIDSLANHNERIANHDERIANHNVSLANHDERIGNLETGKDAKENLCEGL